RPQRIDRGGACHRERAVRPHGADPRHPRGAGCMDRQAQAGISGLLRDRPMNFTSFSKEEFAALRADASGAPIDMLNLIRRRDEADYGDGRQSSGAEAYAAYGRISQPVFARLGGQIVWRGRLDQMLIGPKEEAWDVCFIARYPSATTFAEMVRDPVYRE